MAEPTGDGDDTGGDDVRTLGVSWDEQGVRYKPWRDVCGGGKVYQYKDFPLDGPITALDLGKHMQRYGGSPKGWMMEFCSENTSPPLIGAGTRCAPSPSACTPSAPMTS